MTPSKQIEELIGRLEQLERDALQSLERWRKGPLNDENIGWRNLYQGQYTAFGIAVREARAHLAILKEEA